MNEMHAPLPFVSCIILAAGESKRLGTAKQLLDWHGETILAKAIRTLEGISPMYASGSEIIVVLGARYEEILPTLSPFRIITCKNEHWHEGMGTSISTAMHSVSPHASAVLLSVCDQVLMTTPDYEQLLSAFLTGNSTIAATRYGENSGVPAVFAPQYFPHLQSLSGERGAKSILQQYNDDVTLVDLPAALIDIDTAEDYVRAIGMEEPTPCPLPREGKSLQINYLPTKVPSREGI